MGHKELDMTERLSLSHIFLKIYEFLPKKIYDILIPLV